MWMTSEELQKIGPIHRSDPAQMECLCCHPVRNSSQRGSQAYNFAWFCNSKKESLAIGRIDCELYTTFEEKKHFVRFILLPEQDCSGGMCIKTRYSLEVMQVLGWQRVKEPALSGGRQVLIRCGVGFTHRRND